MLNIKFNIDKICWEIIIVLMCWISILKPLSILSNLSLLIFFAYHIIKQKKESGFNFICISLIILLFSAYSLILQRNVGGVYRFSLILLFLCIAPFIRFKISSIYKVLFYSSFPFVIFIIGFELWMLFFTDSISAGVIRRYVTGNGMGDVYTLGGMYRIQLSGTGCLLAFYMISYVCDIFPKKHKTTIRLLYVLSIIFAGNFAFILGLAVFHILYLCSAKFKRRNFIIVSILLIPIFFLIIPHVIEYLSNTIEQKSAESNAERVFQATALISDLSSNPFSLVFGKGFGNIVEIKGGFRDYSQQGDYYELQSIYFLNQMGFLFFSIYLIYNIWITVYCIPTLKGRIVYISYIIYGSFNPYILNTLHVIVLLLLCNLPRHQKDTNLQPVII